MKTLFLVISLFLISGYVTAQNSLIVLDGPNHVYSDSAGQVKVDVKNCNCEGELFYSINDSLMIDSKKLTLSDGAAEVSFTASGPGMHAIYFNYKCNSATYKGLYVYAVTPF